MDFRDIEKDTLKNSYYRKVVYTTSGLQLVLMSLEPGEDIPEETHPKTVQFFRIESGEGLIKVGNKTVFVQDGDSVIVPAGKKHYVANVSNESPLKMYTIYTPPEHSHNKINKRQPL
jgi:mannose-6-phosphate isomerase-like protein (cupin superfamily)